MAKLIIFVALLAVHYAHGVTVTEDLKTNLNSGLYLNTATSVADGLECQLETSTGEIYKFSPGDKIIPDAPEMRVYSLDRSSCSVGVHPVQKTDNGVWKITATAGAETTEYIYNVYLKKMAGVIPADSAAVREGSFVHGMMAAPKSAFENIKSCVITTPQNHAFNVHTEVVDGVKPVGECGARIVGKSEFNGRWIFEITTNDFYIYTATMRVEVRPAKADDVDRSRFEVELTQGLPGKIEVGPADAKFCQFQNPEHTKLPTIKGPCNYELPFVTPRHEGYWFISYALPGHLNLTFNSFKIIIREQRTISSNVTYDSEKKDFKLSCTAHYMHPRSLSFCRFTRPDGKVFNSAPGATDKKYSTEEANETSSNDIYCGLTIHGRDFADYGGWRCEIGSKDDVSNDVIGTVVYVGLIPIEPDNFNNRLINIQSEAVVVKQGNRYSMKCVADEIMDYCWFRSPNGTAYSTSMSTSAKLPPNTLAYKGAGLQMGECGAEIESAEFSDDGPWTCYFGIANGKEESKTFPVKVAESYLIAAKEKITPYDGVSLSCEILPQEQDRSVHYCRWIRPDGYGIYNGDGERYSTKSTKSECELVIIALSPEDEGNWSCVAGVMGSHVEEMQADIILERRTGSISGIILGFTVSGCVILVLSVVALVIMQVFKRRQQLMPQEPREPREPPAYETHPSPSPRSLNPSFATKEFQY